MRVTVTVLVVLAFVLVAYGLWLVLREINGDAGRAQELVSTARGAVPEDWEDRSGQYLLMENADRAMALHEALAESLASSIPGRRRGAVIAVVGAVLGLAAGLLPLWWQ
jgi:hypothetical protein